MKPLKIFTSTEVLLQAIFTASEAPSRKTSMRVRARAPRRTPRREAGKQDYWGVSRYTRTTTSPCKRRRGRTASKHRCFLTRGRSSRLGVANAIVFLAGRARHFVPAAGERGRNQRPQFPPPMTPTSFPLSVPRKTRQGSDGLAFGSSARERLMTLESHASPHLPPGVENTGR